VTNASKATIGEKLPIEKARELPVRIETRAKGNVFGRAASNQIDIERFMIPTTVSYNNLQWDSVYAEIAARKKPVCDGLDLN
jgi:hypothetical protein